MFEKVFTGIVYHKDLASFILSIYTFHFLYTFCPSLIYNPCDGSDDSFRP